MISLRVQPAADLDAAQRRLVSADYGLDDGPMEIRCREAMAPWLMPMLGLASGGREDDIAVSSLELTNGEALPAWLKTEAGASARTTQTDTA